MNNVHIQSLAVFALLGACIPPTDPVGSIDDETGSGTGGTDPAEGSESLDGADTLGMGESTGGTGGVDPETTGGEQAPPECAAADPTVNAAFEVDLPGWPVHEDFEVDLDVDCTMAPLVLGSDTEIEVQLECDDAGTLRPATITLAYPQVVSTSGDALLPSFELGGEVRLRYVAVADGGGVLGGDGGPSLSHFFLEQFALHSGTALLAAGFDSWGLRPELHAPLSIQEEPEACGVADEDPDLVEDFPMRLTIGDGEGTVQVIGGHQVFLAEDPALDELGYAIAAQEATAVNTIGHTTREYSILIVELTIGEG